MVLSIGKDGDADYYITRQAGYYTGGNEPVGRWYTPDAQFGLVDAGAVDNKIFRDLMAGISPDGEVIGRAPKSSKLERVSSYDMTFSVSKSVSILWAVGDSETRARIEDLMDRSVRRALEAAQDHTAYLRRGGGGVDLVKTRMFGALFQHGDARPMENAEGESVTDMDLHVHSVIFNLAQDERGKWYALDHRHMLDWKMALGATHHAELARLLETELGCRITPTGSNGVFEVSGVPPELIAQFSRRRAQIVESLKAHGLTSAEAPELAAAVAKASRQSKLDNAYGRLDDPRFERWAKEALASEFSEKEIMACFLNPLTDTERQARDDEFGLALKTIAHDITETSAVVERREVHRQVAALCAAHGRGADDVERIVADIIDPDILPTDLLSWDDDKFEDFIAGKIASGKLVTLPVLQDIAGLSHLTSPDLIRAERGIWRLVDQHVADSRHVVPFADVEAFIARLRQSTDPANPPATEEQENGIRYVTTQSGLVISMEGAAGSGKSVTLKQVTALYRDILGPALGVDYRVLGCSAKWLTAKAMIEDADLADEDAKAAAKWIYDIRSGKVTISERTILLVDEAGQMGSRDLHALLEPFIAAGAKIILTGDRAQQRSVGAGPSLDIVASRIGSLRLERTQRMAPQADDVLVHRDGLSRSEAIIRAFGLSSERRRILVDGAAPLVRAEVRARFNDAAYQPTPDELLIWAHGMAPLEALRTASRLSDRDRRALMAGSVDLARENALAWAADPEEVVSAVLAHHYLDGQPWTVAERRAAFLTDEQRSRFLNGHAGAVREAVRAWALSPDSEVTAADVMVWLDNVDRRAAEAFHHVREEHTHHVDQTAGREGEDAGQGKGQGKGEGAFGAAHQLDAYDDPVGDAAPGIDSLSGLSGIALAGEPKDASMLLPRDEDSVVDDDGSDGADRLRRADSGRVGTGTRPTEEALGAAITAAGAGAKARSVPLSIVPVVDVAMASDLATSLLTHPVASRPDPARVAAAKAAALAWANADGPKPKAEDVLHWVHGMSWTDAFARVDGLSAADRDALVVTRDPTTRRNVMTAEARRAIDAASAWANTPMDAIKAADVLVHVFGLPRAEAESRASALSPEDQGKLVSRHYRAVRDDGQIWARQAATDFSYGPTDPHLTMRALRAYHEHGRMKWCHSHEDALRAAVEGWKSYLLTAEPDQTAVVLAKSNMDVRALNRWMRDHFREKGHIAETEVVISTVTRQRVGRAHLKVDLPISAGEQILFTRRDDELGVVNGTIGKVLSIKPSRYAVHAILTVRISSRGRDDRDITFDTASYTEDIKNGRGKDGKPKRGWVPGPTMLEHAYAVTNFSVQGMTKTAAFAQIDSSQKSNSVYVAASRAVALTYLYASRQAEDMYLKAALPLRERDKVVFTDRERLRNISSHIARGQRQSSTLDAFAPEWRDRIRTERAEGYYDPEMLSMEWRSFTEDASNVDGQPDYDPEHSSHGEMTPPKWLADGPSLDAYHDAVDQGHEPGPDWHEQYPGEAPLSEFSGPGDLPPTGLFHQSLWPGAKLEPPYFPRAAKPPAIDKTILSFPVDSSNVVNARPPASPEVAAGSAARIWLRGVEGVEVSPMSPPSRTAPGRRNFVPYEPASKRRSKAFLYDLEQVKREYDEMLAGAVDLRDILGAHGWKAVKDHGPGKDSFWTTGSIQKIDSDCTISIIRKHDGWKWTGKAAGGGGNILSFGIQYLGWNLQGKGFFETWKELREFWPDAPSLQNETPETAEQKQAREERLRAADERREAERLAQEEAERVEVANTHRDAAVGWSRLKTPASTGAGNYLEGRGISRATQYRYADSIRYGGPSPTFVAFKHIKVDGAITGFERKGDGYNKFSDGSGGKAIAVFGNLNAAITRIVITETGVDALSKAQRDGCPPDALYISTGGQSNATLGANHFTAEHIAALARRFPAAVVELATDRDTGGNSQAAGWAGLLADHPGGLVRVVPEFVNDWNNLTRIDNPSMLDPQKYSKDLCKAVPSLPPPPATRPDLLPFWQNYEAARPHLREVRDGIARAAGAWDEGKGEIDLRAWKNDLQARELWRTIHEAVAAGTPLPDAISSAVTAGLPAWHGWRAQRGALEVLEARLVRELAWDDKRDRKDFGLWNASGGLDYVKAIAERIQRDGIPLVDAIPAALVEADAEVSGEVREKRAAARSVIQVVRAEMIANPESTAVSPSTLNAHPHLTSLMEVASRLKQDAAPLPDPATWKPDPAPQGAFSPRTVIRAPAPSPEMGRIREDLSAKLIAAGMSPEEAAINSAMVASRYDARAARLGGRAGNAWEMYQAEGIDIRGPSNIAPSDEQSWSTLGQPLNADVDPNRMIPVVDVTGMFEADRDNPSLMTVLRSLAGDHLPTADQGRIALILPKNVRHVVFSSAPIRRQDRAVRGASINSIVDLLEQAPLIESAPNAKPDKSGVDSYHRFYVPVWDGKQARLIRIVAEQTKAGIIINPNSFDLYDVILEDRRPPPNRSVSPDASRMTPLQMGGQPPEVSIRQMLAGVKDMDGQPYFASLAQSFEQAAWHGRAFHQSPVITDIGNARLAAHQARWSQDVDRFLAGAIDPHEQLLVMDTPLVVSMLGAEQLPIRTRLKVLKKVLDEKHDLPPDVAKQLPSAIADPVMVLASATQPGSFVLVLDLVDQHSATVNVAIHLEKTAGGFVTNDLSTAFGRKHADGTTPDDMWFIDQMTAGRALYVNEEKSQQWALRRRLQLPMAHALAGLSESIYRGPDLVNLRSQAPSLYQKDWPPASMLPLTAAAEINRGLITIAPGHTIINLMQTADKSTFMHEMSHLWLDEMARDAAHPDAPEDLRRDWQTVLDWLGVSHASEITRPHHEQWARGFEQFLMEGRSPSEPLDKVFDLFGEWLGALYHTVDALQCPINDEVRAAMGRLVTRYPDAVASWRRPTAASSPEPFPSAMLRPAAPDEPPPIDTAPLASTPGMDARFDDDIPPPTSEADYFTTAPAQMIEAEIMEELARHDSDRLASIDHDPLNIDTLREHHEDAIMSETAVTQVPPVSNPEELARRAQASMASEDAQAESEELGRAEAAMRADDELRARNFMPGLIGEEFGVDASSDRLKHEYLKELGKWYETFFAAKHEQDIDFVRYNPGESPEVEIHFRDGSELKDAGDKLLLSGKATPQKADLMIQIAVAKGLTEVRLRGSKEFKRDLAKSCYEHGVTVLNPEMRKYMAELAAAMPERAGMYRDTATALPPAPPVPATPPTAPPSSTSPEEEASAPSSAGSTATPAVTPADAVTAAGGAPATATEDRANQGPIADEPPADDPTGIDAYYLNAAATAEGGPVLADGGADVLPPLSEEQVDAQSLPEDLSAPPASALAPDQVMDAAIQPAVSEVALPASIPSSLPEAGERLDVDGVAYQGLSGGLAGVTMKENHALRAQMGPILFGRAMDVLPQETAHGRLLMVDVIVGKGGTTHDGACIPVRLGDGVRFMPVVALTATNPLNVLYNEAAHVHLREGRFSDDQLAGFRDPGIYQALAARFDVAGVPDSRRDEECLAHLAGEWGGGAASLRADAAFQETAAAASDRRGRLAHDLNLSPALTSWLDGLVSGEVGRMPSRDDVKVLALEEMGASGLTDPRIGPLPQSVPPTSADALEILLGSPPADPRVRLEAARVLLEDKTATPIHRAFAAHEAAETVAALTASGRYAELVAASPSVDDFNISEMAQLTNVDTEYQMRDAPTAEYAARIAPYVASIEATAELHWTIDNRVTGYDQADFGDRQTLLTEALQSASSEDREAISAAVDKAVSLNQALLASVGTTPAHLCETASVRIAAAQTVAECINGVVADTTISTSEDAGSNWTTPAAQRVASLAQQLSNAPTPVNRVLAASRLYAEVMSASPEITGIESTHLGPIEIAEGREGVAISHLAYAQRLASDQAGRVFANPDHARQVIGAASDETIQSWADTPPALGELGDLGVPPAGYAGDRLAQEQGGLTAALQSMGRAAVDRSERVLEATSLRQAMDSDPRVPAALELREAVRTAIPWQTFPVIWKADPMDVVPTPPYSSVSTRLDVAQAVLRHAADPARANLTAEQIAAMPPGEDRNALVAWVDMSSKENAAAKSANGGFSSAEGKLGAFNAAERLVQAASYAAAIGQVAGNSALVAAAALAHERGTTLAGTAAQEVLEDAAAMANATAQGAVASLHAYAPPPLPHSHDQTSAPPDSHDDVDEDVPSM